MITDIPLDADEKLLLKVNRTAVGLVLLYLVGLVALVGLLIAVYLIAKNQAEIRQTMPIPMAILIAVVGAGLIVLLDYSFIKVYRGNQLIVTNERLVLLTQTGLFHQSVPQINLGDVQEVAIHQHGFLPHLFNYGTVVVETAGEQKNIILKYAANPHQAVEQIDNAAEVFKTYHPAARG